MTFIPRKRNKGCGLFLEPGGGEASKDDESDSEDGESAESNPHMKESDKRQKEDALWASFLSDVGQKPKAPPAVQASGCTQKDKVRRGHVSFRHCCLERAQ